MTMAGQVETFLKEFNAAFERGDVEFILDNVTDDIHWHMIGASIVDGKEALRREMRATNEARLPVLNVERIITHGKDAAVVGTMQLPDHAGEVKEYGFCDVYEMSDASPLKVRSVKGFVIEM
jgi:ketosteroid isomerase-like protein